MSKEGLYVGTMFYLKNHIKLDVHREFHLDVDGRKIVTLVEIDVCSTAWMFIICIAKATFYQYAKYAYIRVAA